MRQCDQERRPRSAIIRGLRKQALPPPLRRPLIAVSGICACVALWLGIRYAGTSSPSPIDDRIYDFAVGISDSFRVALVSDASGEPRGAIFLIVVISAVCIALRRWRLALLTVCSQAVIGGMTNLVKPLFDRTIHGPFLSYPSGHTAGATAFALVIGLLLVSLVQLRRSVALAIVLGAGMINGAFAAWAQTILVAHYAVDTVGGFFFGIAVFGPVALIIDAAVGRLPGLRHHEPRDAP